MTQKLIHSILALGSTLVLLALAGCQVVPFSSQTLQGASASNIVTTRGQRAVHASPQQVVAANPTAESIRVFLADIRPRPGWTPVHLKPSGVLYVRTDAVLERSDLVGIQSATDQAGGGILVLILSEQGFQKIHQATAANPGLRLALVVGQTMLAAPGYVAPIRERQLAFSVGSARNAELAARAVAGVR